MNRKWCHLCRPAPSSALNCGTCPRMNATKPSTSNTAITHCMNSYLRNSKPIPNSSQKLKRSAMKTSMTPIDSKTCPTIGHPGASWLATLLHTTLTTYPLSVNRRKRAMSTELTPPGIVQREEATPTPPPHPFHTRLQHPLPDHPTPPP